MGFLKKAFDFIAHPTHSRTFGLVIMLVFVAAVSLTVYVAQQQQSLKQRASDHANCTVSFDWSKLILEEDAPSVFTITFDGTSNSEQINDTQKTYTNVSSGKHYINVTAKTPRGITWSLSSNANAVCPPSPTPAQIAIAPTKTPTRCVTQGGECTLVNVACDIYGSYVAGGYGSPYCSDSAPQCCVPNLSPTPTFTPTPTPINCRQFDGNITGCDGAQQNGFNQCNFLLCNNQCLPKNISYDIACPPSPTPAQIAIAPTKAPTQCVTQGGKCTSVNVACNNLGSYVYGGYGSPYCSDSAPQCCVPNLSPTPTLKPTSTPTSAPTPTKPPTSVPIPTRTPAPTQAECNPITACQFPAQQCTTGSTTYVCSQVTSAPISTPTPVSATVACIKLIDVNSLARKYAQGDPTVTLQMVNIKARQYKQNPCL